MNARLGDTEFDHATFDGKGDVLYLHVGAPRGAADAYGTPEGHALRLDAGGRTIGLTIVNARWLLDGEGAIRVTPPDGNQLDLEGLEDVLVGA